MMVLWTILPMEFVLQQDVAETNSYRETFYKGAKVLVESVSSSECRIMRVISTDPNDFLRTDIQPGTIIHLW